MHVRTLLIAATALAAVAPAVCNAGPESAALKTCTAAFASSLGVKGAAAPTVKLNYRDGQASSAFAEYYTHEYTFFLKGKMRIRVTLEERGAKDVRGTCLR